LALGLAAMAFCEFGQQPSWDFKEVDRLALLTFGFLCFLLAEAFLLVGTRTLSRIAFPVCFLAFMIPFPTPVLDRIDYFLQHGSAYVAHGFFLLAGMPVVRTGMHFELPSFSMLVAPECSGVHSTLVLLITSLLAGYVLLRTFTVRAILALVVIPLALLRNGFRVFVIGELCVHIGPHMISSPIHRHGGPIFFALSLVALFCVLYFLRRSERKRRSAAG
jgi:exosortase C (VPDSG-CTERM-specific)